MASGYGKLFGEVFIRLHLYENLIETFQAKLIKAIVWGENVWSMC